MGLFVCTRIAKHLLGPVITLLFHNTVAIRKLAHSLSLSTILLCVVDVVLAVYTRMRRRPRPPGRVYVRSFTPAVALTNFTTPS